MLKDRPNVGLTTLRPPFRRLISYVLVMENGSSNVTRSNKRPLSELENDNPPHSNGGKSLDAQDEGKCSSGLHSLDPNVRPDYG